MKYISCIILSLTFLALSAQTKVSSAFEKSYNNEYQEEYVLAAQDIQAVYNESSYEMNFRLGWLYFMTQDYTKSSNYYKKSVEIRPNSIEARLGYVLPVSAMENWDEVIKVYQEILKIDPSNSVVNYRMGYIFHYMKKNNEMAYKYAKKTVNLYPFDFDANYLLGDICVSMGKIAEAKEHLNRALNYNPSSEVVIKALENL